MSEKPTREVPLHRIKPLHSHGKLMKIGGYSDEEAIEKIAARIAEEFASKLMEFNKIKIERDNHGNVIFDVKLEVIVPEAPEDRAGTETSAQTQARD